MNATSKALVVGVSGTTLLIGANIAAGSHGWVVGTLLAALAVQAVGLGLSLREHRA